MNVYANIFGAAVDSVRRRGFHSVIVSEHWKNANLVANLARLAEEIGEWSESKNEVDELADIVIVCAQLAYLLEFELSLSLFEMEDTGDVNLTELLGTFARGLRKNDSSMYQMALSCLVGDCVQLAKRGGCVDFVAQIANKLRRDDLRGYLHGARLN